MTPPAGRRPAVAIRVATDDDLVSIQEIYAHHVLTGVASFEETAPNVEEHRRRHRAVVARGLPYLVAELESGLRGYAYASLYRERSAYRYAVENSIYVAENWGGRGVGAALLGALIERCTVLGMRQMVAVIGDSANAASIALHSRLGFRVSGTLPSIGFKFGRWVDSVIMSRPLGDGDQSPPGD